MTKNQKKIAQRMIREGGYTFGQLYRAVYQTDPKIDCVCAEGFESGKACDCFVSHRIWDLHMLCYETT